MTMRQFIPSHPQFLCNYGVDYPHLANHHAVEAEPDVVLVVYMGHYMEPGQADDRILRLRVTGQGLVLDK